MVTRISIRPLPAGDVAVMLVGDCTVKPVAAVTPNTTAVALLKLLPVMVTSVPPVAGPEIGAIEETVGGAT